MWRRPQKDEETDPKEAEITRLLKTIRRQHDQFLGLLNHRDRLAQVGASLDDSYRILSRLDRDLTRNEQELASLGYLPKHKEKEA